MRKCFELCKSGVKAMLEDGRKKVEEDPPKQSEQTSQQGAEVKQGVFSQKSADLRMRDLALQVEGFGRDAIGGLYGSVYHVTTLDDSGHGSLRQACKTVGPLWIIFDVSGIIVLSSAIRVTSYKTIDGRGQRVKLMGNGLQLRGCEHVIICNIEFQSGRGHDVDGIQLKPNTQHVWIDQCSLSDYDDGLIDITRQSTDVTVSRCYFFNHDKTMLIGADPKHVDDRCIRVTIHHCFFDGTRQRHPRLRFFHSAMFMRLDTTRKLLNITQRRQRTMIWQNQVTFALKVMCS
eukprot:c24963_g1_i2 orf=964-1830(-)